MRQTCMWTMLLGMVLWTACSPPETTDTDSESTQPTVPTNITTAKTVSNTTAQNPATGSNSGPGSGASTWAGTNAQDVQPSDPYAFVETKTENTRTDNTFAQPVDVPTATNDQGTADVTTSSDTAGTADDVVWLTDLVAAKAQAEREHKILFLFFTGSDWCGWCMRLQKEVLTQPEFAAWAKEKAVLVDLDFPRNQPQSDQLKQQNAELAKQHQIDGYPTIVLTTADGTTIAQTGYREGGAAAYVEYLRMLVP
ncbi:MAG: thioredoxin family protein [Thermoguttaceae bacterium]|nr:thioredoxin family protein [Thermoguttaceae bacterium]